MALSNLSFTIERGSAVGIVGPSGSGKTTAVDVLLGLLRPTDGRVVVDGSDIASNLAAWQQQIGYVPQFIYLLDDTIKRNIAFGLPDEAISADALNAAIDASQLRELVNELPDGVETNIGERGVRLSGGQRQRLGIARALYHAPSVLVMDEATSSLDSDTEAEVVTAIGRLKGSRTIITIAHRLSTVRSCDVILELRQGHIQRHDADAFLARVASA
jgi:ABC-type multidrug transport system fused ATPase/permease subunit